MKIFPQIMVDNNVRHIPVVHGCNLLGMLSMRDVLQEIVAEHRTEVQTITDYIQGSY